MLTNFIYVNVPLLDEYCSQLGLTGENSLSKITSKAAVSLTGPAFESTREYAISEQSLKKRIDRFTQKLLVCGLIANERFKDMTSLLRGEIPEQIFGLEVVQAVKMTFLKKHLEQLPGVKELAVWVADPFESDLTTEKWPHRGTFLLLPQINFDNFTFQSVHSGCSALQAVMNGFEGKSLLLGANGEPLGRGSFDHPIEKLRSCGAIASPPQEIRVLYRMRYMTDEQCYTHAGTEHRVNDLLAYPIFIATEARREASKKQLKSKSALPFKH